MMTLQAMRRYWRIPVLALLSAILAFGGSFLVSKQYTSKTRLLIHGQDATFLSSTGTDPAQQPKVADGTLSQALAQTYAGVATSRSVAIAVVDGLGLDAPDTGHGPIHALQGAAAWTYKCTRAFITFGYCAPANRREKAIEEVTTGARAEQLGVTSGAAAGQPGSYVLEVSGSGTSGVQAMRVTNALADELVSVSAARFRQQAQTYVKALQQQVNLASKNVSAKSTAVADYETEHGISAADEQQVLNAKSFDTLQTDLRNTKADLADNQAQLASVNASIAATASTSTSDQRISTGRSDTSVTTKEVNPVYSSLQSQKAGLQSRIDGLQARRSQLEQQVAGTSPTGLNAQQARLAELLQDVELAKGNETALTQQLQNAQTQVAVSESELTRIDQAGVPAYPVAPKRYLYLAIGLLLGGLAGGGLTWRARQRHDPNEPEPGQPHAPDSDATRDLLADLSSHQQSDPIEVRQPARAANGSVPVGARELPADGDPPHAGSGDHGGGG
ncbi:hypothetical protein GCM10023317_57620 [Actinopolymorpha pittospori]